MKEYIRRLDEKASRKIEAVNLHRLARVICDRAGWKGRIGEDKDYDAIWASVRANPELGELPMDFEDLIDEYWQVIDANGIDSEEGYLTAVRTGRPKMTRSQKKKAWPVFLSFQRGLKKRNLLTFEGAVHQARLAVEAGNFKKFRHVLVDEAQDFGLEALRLVRALSPVEENLSDPLCMAGDGHQRIYRAKFPMSRAGIDIRGRSRRLKVNYRTSEQIRKYAQAMLQGLDIDDLDGASVSTAGDHSVFKGPEPIVESCQDRKQEAEAIVAWIQLLMKDHGLASHDICVTPYKPEIVTALTEADISAHLLKPRELDPGTEVPGVRLGTIKRIKGLEFRAVALACADPDDPMNRLEQADALSRCERYVASTRAREHLIVTVASGVVGG